ncbi:hypothetical protein QQ045_017606 [Rhodiola kirilowii]
MAGIKGSEPHPDGKLEKMYWSVSASEVMRKNPDHYVSLILPLPDENSNQKANVEARELKSTHIKLLRSSDTLILGSAYRLVASKGFGTNLYMVTLLLAEVLYVLRAKKSARTSMRRVSPERITDKNVPSIVGVADKTTLEEDIFKETGKQLRPLTKKPSMRRSKSWHPSLKTIAEIPSQ